ncbi:AI-2E family transporter [Mucilaginibacter robiniae]|uniref:AI-2E family transporter n=1 Tax=Mucilaginibacter robiniae TaxID=2728022 RepID=A0A7L5E1Q8_9SPHI|nr:AI-2E family transporter [Mucilaginibacter robiniae]QJD96249.1 AI-2E family transporter [Mucilaginibacter robiniae]
MAIVTFVVSLAFFLMDVKYAFLLGLITGLFNIIPCSRILTALILSAAITFATAAVTSEVLLAIIPRVIAHLIDSNVLLSVIVGSKVRTNAFMTVPGVVIGEMIGSVPGMFLSIAVIAVLKNILDLWKACNLGHYTWR